MHIFQLGPGNAYFVIQTVLLLQLLISGSIVREQWQCVSKLSANKTLFIILANSLDFAVDQLVNPHCRVKKKKKKKNISGLAPKIHLFLLLLEKCVSYQL